ncbi:glucose-6-phosphate dehydrogenase [Treponema sp.]
MGLPSQKRPLPFVLVVYGASGDLAARKLYPAFFSLFREGALDDWKLIGFGRRPWSDEDFRKEVSASIASLNPTERERIDFLAGFFYAAGAYDEAKAYEKLATMIPVGRELIHYLAVPPESYGEIVEQLGLSGLAKRAGSQTRVVIEKPFGRSGAEAAALNSFIAERFDEKSIFRIDHYLGKETVQNIAVLRFGNGIFEPLWNSRYVDHVEITVAEAVGVEKRAPYYERSGALRDMVQNHLLQLLALVAMEAPSSFSADAVRDEKVKVFRALRPIREEDLAVNTIRARYTSGFVDGLAVPGYLDEEGVAADSLTETFAALKIHVDSWRWSGVPFILRTGKRMNRRLSEIAIHFKKPPLELFPPGWTGGNQLVFRIHPEEGLTLYLNTKIPGLSDRSRSVSMDFLYGTGFGAPSPEAYERLLLDALVGDGTLYTRRDEVESSWAFIDPIRRAWDEDLVPVLGYEAGRAGPRAASNLPASFGRSWRRL